MKIHQMCQNVLYNVENISKSRGKVEISGKYFNMSIQNR